jgi:ADP-ribose pyrophosphatase
MKNPYKTLSKKIMYKSEFLTVREDQILNGNKKGIYSVIFRNGKGGISVIAKDKKGDFYLVKQWRYPINKEAIEFVAGKIDKNETPLQAAKRELFEELGLISKSWISLGQYNQAIGFCNIKMYIYLAENIEIKDKNFQTNEEYTEMIKLSEKDLHKYIKSEKIEDDLSLATYTKYLIYKNKIK